MIGKDIRRAVDSLDPNYLKNVIFNGTKEEMIKAFSAVKPAAHPRIDLAPVMPVIFDSINQHRERIPDLIPWYSACVARTMLKDEIRNNPKAKAAEELEWGRLRRAGAWDESGV